MDEHVYAVPDLTTDVRYGPGDRGEREERIVDIYVSADHLDPDPDPPVQQNTTRQQHGASAESWKNNAFKAATVCGGVLCVILLAVITGLGVRKLSGWMTFGRGCYYISTEGKTWDQSRKYCRDHHSDLIIINNKEEQDFVNRTVNWDQFVWLGLTDREEEGVWKWVDGTPLTSPTYWIPGEPSNNVKKEDCAAYLNAPSNSSNGWHTVPCTWNKRCMCEKVV